MVPSLEFPGIAGVTVDSFGDVFISYNNADDTGQQEAVAEVSPSGSLIDARLFVATGPSAFPGALTTVGSAASLPIINAPNEILELQPNGQVFYFNPSSMANGTFDNLASYSANASNVFNLQSGSYTNLNGAISLANATFGDFGVHGSSLVISAESNEWDFVMRMTYGPGGGVATVLAASPAGDELSASPGGVAVDSQGTVLTTLPYLPTGSATMSYLPVGFDLFYDQGNSPAPYVPTLGLTTAPSIECSGITIDSHENFILAAVESSLCGGGSGIVHVNSALTAFLAHPTINGQGTPGAVAYQTLGRKDELAVTRPDRKTYTIAGELPLFSGQVTPAQVRQVYGINQIRFLGPGGITVAGDGTGQTIAIVEEGASPNLGADLSTFDQFFGIPAPPSFQVVYQSGVTTQNPSIADEAALDVEWAHAIAPGASIVVYNAAYDANDARTSTLNLFLAMQQASMISGVSVVTLSYSAPEDLLASSGINQKQTDAYFTTPGVTFLASAGDSGIYGNGGSQVGAKYPAASPNVLSVGGTSIKIDAAGDYPGTDLGGEVGWGAGMNSGARGGGGGGLSTVESEPAWQTGVIPVSLDPSGARAMPDVAIDSGSIQPFDVFTSTLSGSDASAAVGWISDAGTSVSSPIWAALIAIANQGRALQGGTPLTGYTQTLPALYSLPSTDFHDIVNGNNGDPAQLGFDLVTGLGTPVANLLVPDLSGYQQSSRFAITAEPPSSVAADSPFGLTVQVEDSLGNMLAGSTGGVMVALGMNPGGATLGGTLTAPIVNGVATFSGLTIGQPGTGYTLSLTASDGSAAQVTTPIDVTQPRRVTRVVVTASPDAPVFGESVTLTATVTSVSPGTGVPTGSVTFEVGMTSLGTIALSDGVASMSTTAAKAGTVMITTAYEGDVSDQPSRGSLSQTVSQAPATLSLATLAAIYDGSPHATSVSTSPPGLSGVSVTYARNGAAVASPTQAGNYTVTAQLDNPNYLAPAATTTLVIAQATSTITWPNPASITYGAPLGSAQLDAMATFNGQPLTGMLTYTPKAGTVLPLGNGQILKVSFTPTDGANFQPVTASVLINVTPSPARTLTPTPTATSPLIILDEQSLFRRRTNQRGKPVLAGFAFTFNTSLDPSSGASPANYRVDTVSTKHVKTKDRRILHPFTGFMVSYNAASDTVTLMLTGKQEFKTGGQITIVGGASGGLIGASGATLAESVIFSIAKQGKTIVPE